MQLKETDINWIAWLARLSIEREAIPGYVRDLSNILTMIEQMEQVNTDAIEPVAHPLELTARLRDDVVTEANQRDHFQAIAPETANGHYLVPRVIE